MFVSLIVSLFHITSQKHFIGFSSFWRWTLGMTQEWCPIFSNCEKIQDGHLTDAFHLIWGVFNHYKLVLACGSSLYELMVIPLGNPTPIRTSQHLWYKYLWLTALSVYQGTGISKVCNFAIRIRFEIFCASFALDHEIQTSMITALDLSRNTYSSNTH